MCGGSHLIHLLCHKRGFSAFFSMALFLGAVKHSTYACQQNSSLFPFNLPDYFSGGYFKKSERKTHLLGEDRLFKCQEKTSSICTVIKAKTLKIDFHGLHNNWNPIYWGDSISVTKETFLSDGGG